MHQGDSIYFFKLSQLDHPHVDARELAHHVETALFPSLNQAGASLTAYHVDARKLAYFFRNGTFAVAQPNFAEYKAANKG